MDLHAQFRAHLLNLKEQKADHITVAGLSL